MTVNLLLFFILFFRPGMIFLPGKKMGALWVPWAQRPSTPGQPAQPKSPKGIRPRSQPAQERPADPPPGYPKGIRLISQPAHERLANPSPGRRVSHIPDAFLTQVLTFPIEKSIKQSFQPTLHITSVSSPVRP